MRNIWLVLKHEKEFRKMTVSDVLSGLGSWFSNIAIIILLFQITGVSLALGVTLALRTVPLLILGPVGGYLADKYNKKHIIVASGLIRALLVLFLLMVNTETDIWMIYLITVMLASVNSLSLASKQSIVPKLVKEKNLPAANSISQSTGGAIMTLGGALGGAVSGAVGTDFAFIFNSLMFLFSSFIILRINYSENEHSNIDFEESVSFYKIFKHSFLIKLIALQSIIWPIGGGTINVLISVYGYEMLNAGETGVGFLYAALGIGFLISGIVSPKTFKYLLPIIMFSTILEGLSHIGVSQATHLFWACLLLIIGTISAGVGNIYVNTLTMKYIPEKCLGRMFSLNEVASSIVMTLSMVGAGFLLESFPPHIIGLYAGLIITLTSLTVIPLFFLNLDNERQKIKNIL